MAKGLLDEITSHGDRGAVLPFSRVEDVRQDVLALKNEAFQTSWLQKIVGWIEEDSPPLIPPDIGFVPRSLITVVMPGSGITIRFAYRGKQVDCILPPQYDNHEDRNEQKLRYIRSYLKPLGFSAAALPWLPQKLLAVHAGLGLYGRNNICYHNEFGSHIQIMTYASDMPCGESEWHPLRRMELCESCRACEAACPTGAIDAGRRLIDADRCLTALNEFPGEFPAWLSKDAHNSIVGCIRCQACCPANAQGAKAAAADIVFSEAETTVLLNHVAGTPFTEPLAAKVEAMGIPEYAQVLPRNVAALLQKEC